MRDGSGLGDGTLADAVVAETTSGDQDATVEGSDHAVVVAHGGIERGAHLAHVVGERAEAFVELAPEPVDLACVVSDGLLTPHVRHGAQQGKQRGRRGDDDIAGERPVEKRRILAKRDPEHRLGWKEHHDGIDGVVVLAPVVLGAESIGMSRHIACMLREESRSRVRVILCLGLEKGTQGNLGIDDDPSTGREIDDHVRTLDPAVARPHVLLDEVHSIDEP